MLNVYQTVVQEAVRALKRRVAELEQQLQVKEAEAQAGLGQLQDQRRQGQERSADVAASMAKLEEQLHGEAR